MSSEAPETPTKAHMPTPDAGPVPEPECPEVGECPTSTINAGVAERLRRRDRGIDTPLVHITADTSDRTRCGKACPDEEPAPMPTNAGIADEWVVEHLGRRGPVEVCHECALAYLGTEQASISWRHRLAAQAVYGRDIGTSAEASR